jgi:hypothetical protein
MSSKQTSYLSLGGLIRLGLIFTVLYTAYAFDGVSTAVGSGWAVKMKLQGKARECPWPQVLQFYPHLEEFNTRYASYLHQVKVLELDPNFPIVKSADS